MTFEDVMRKSIRAYWKGKEPSNIFKTTQKKIKYTKKYFDKLEKEYFGNVTEVE